MLIILNKSNRLKNHIVLKVDSKNVRYMYKSVTKAVNINLIRQNGTCNPRNMSCLHSGKLRPVAKKPIVHDTDVSGRHEIVTKTVCKETNCKAVDCADPNEINANCPGRTALQNQTDIPPTAQGFTTEIIGNTTSKIPQGKKGFVVNQNTNYSGQYKTQYMVVETNPVQIDSKDLHVNNQSTTFAQGHHATIIKNIP